MSLPFDATLKGILGGSPADLCKPFRLPAIEPAHPLNVDLSTISAATDIAFGFGDPLQEIADLNFQSGPDPHVDARLHLYNAAFHARFHVPVRSILVLLRPRAETLGLTGKLSYTSGNNRVLFEYDVIRMWQEPVQPFLDGGLSVLPLAMLCRMPPGKPLEKALRQVMREIDRRLGATPDHAAAVRVMTGAYILTSLRVTRDRADSIFQGASIMHEKVGWDEMVDEGRVRANRRALLSQGSKLFGEPNAKTRATLIAIDDPERLERMVDAILDLKSWKELLAVK
jgi:hypothetical protein